MNYHALSDQVKQYALAFFISEKNDQLIYHDLAHTEGVVKAAVQISNHYQLNDHDFFVVYAAVWFHDIGYFSGGSSGHEKKGAEQAAAFLAEQGVDEQTIDQVKGCIGATTVPQNPTTLLEQIVCDADMFHLGTDEFSERNKLMRKECEVYKHIAISKEEWRRGSIQLLQEHEYHTDYCKLLLNAKKQENLNKLLQKQSEAKAKETPVLIPQPATELPAAPVDISTGKKHKKTKFVDRPDKGIETMFRVASTNHQRLSDLSDNKAHIMISVNSIIISVIIGLVVRRLDASPNIIVPTLILLTGSMLAVIFSVLATRPKIPKGVFTKEQVDDKTANLLFFGNFYNMQFTDYYDGMKKVMADREFLYGSLIRDIYSQGTVLGRKYKLLRISYTIFMYTLIISIIAFAVATTFFA